MPVHAYSLVIYEADDSSVDVTIDSGAIAELPESFGGQRIDIVKGRSESLNWSIVVLEELTAAPVTTFSQYLADTGGRAVLLQRRVALRRAIGGAAVETVAGGRLLDIVQTPEMAWQLEIGDELWIARNTDTFTTGNKTRVFTPGIVSNTADLPDRSEPLTCSSTGYTVGNGRYFSLSPTYKVPRAVAEVIREDVLPGVYYVDSSSTSRVYRTLKFRLSGSTVNYDVAGFDGSLQGFAGGYFAAGVPDSAEISSIYIRDPGATLPATVTDQACYLYAPNAAASRALPLHIADDIYGIHPFRFLKRLYDGDWQRTVDPDTGDTIEVRTVRYSTAAMADAVDSASVVPQRIFPRITEPMSIAAAAERYVYALTGYVPALDNTGAVKPVNTRLPSAETVPATSSLYEFNADNVSTVPTWRHGVKEQVTAITFRYDSVGVAEGTTSVQRDTPSLDGYETSPYSFERRSDRVDEGVAIKRVLSHDLAGIKNRVYADAPADAFAADMFARYGDGPQYARFSALPSASTVSTGDTVMVDVDTFPNTASRTRGGRVMMQVVSRAGTITGQTYEAVHTGADLQPVAAPTVTLSQSTADPKHSLDIDVVGATTSFSAEVQLSRSSSAGAYRTVATAGYDESLTVTELASGTKYWGRARLQVAGRIRSNWGAADSTSTVAMTPPSALASTVSGQNWAQLTWTVGETDERVQIKNSTQGVFANLPVGSDQYLVRGLVAGSTYVFQVRHKDEFGGFSAYSTECSVQTSTAGSTGFVLAVSTPTYLEITAGDDSITSRVS